MPVMIFAGTNFSGQSLALDVGEHPLTTALELKQAVSSIKVDAGLVAMVFESFDDQGGLGRFADLLEDCPDLAPFALDNCITYISVFPTQKDTVAHKHEGGTTTDVTTSVAWVRGQGVGSDYAAGYWMRAPAPAQSAVLAVSPLLPSRMLQVTTVAGDPWVNPAFDTSNNDWASTVVSAPFDADASPLEWVSVLAPDSEQDDQVAVSGYAMHPEISANDVPFVHPFGGDFEYGLVPDREFEGLLAVSNMRTSDYAKAPDGFGNAFADADTHYLRAEGMLGMEVDAALVPDTYRAQTGDRVALYGRWIIDAGHPPFHTEIHPPLLMARARAVTAENNVVPASYEATTLFTLWGRPYLTGQFFQEGDDRHVTLKNYILKQDLLEHDHGARFYPPLFPTTFVGQHAVSFVLRPPIPSPPAVPAQLGTPQLMCSYAFTTNGGAGIQVQTAPSDPNAVQVLITLNAEGLPGPSEPPQHFEHFDAKKLKDAIPGTLSWGSEKVLEWMTSEHPVISIRMFDGPAEPDVTTHTVPFTPVHDLPKAQVNIDTTQPFPIIGWLRLKWGTTGGKAAFVPQGVETMVKEDVQFHL